MIIRDHKINRPDTKTIDFSQVNSKNLLLIFTRNTVLGKCKTRLAVHIGDRAALESYRLLLKHTLGITSRLHAHKVVYYSEEIPTDDIWPGTLFEKKVQQGADLGQRMANAFANGFDRGFEKIIVMGSDMLDLEQRDLEAAFGALEDHEVVLGPALDGGYYLLGMKQERPELFMHKDWGTDTVLEATLEDLKDTKTALLQERNDIDRYEDIKDNPAFAPILKKYKK
ncbi:TIGR04282 family arsenosugar biosynthesis glycosyltransferase [Maribacter sp. 2307ULW6-5]|uniref:TIGR04282 family arsenosugar biosynthesis glycosyltransferase n=1 Tax=Maribacter sp. 2307ULW6-5 TaxID=3386275 RepID=UPI0039BCBBC8